MFPLRLFANKTPSLRQTSSFISTPVSIMLNAACSVEYVLKTCYNHREHAFSAEHEI